MADRAELIDAKLSRQHIIKEGARFHVISYGALEGRRWPWKTFAVSWCSEPFCERNRDAVLACVEAGLDPAKCTPSPLLKDWLTQHALLRSLEAKEGER